MFPELEFHLRAVTRMIYFVTDEEDRFFTQLHQAMRDNAANVKVYNATYGLQPLPDVITDWQTKNHTTDQSTMLIHDALISIYKEQTPRERRFYVITDPERWLKDAQVQRRLLNILHQVHNDAGSVKVLIFVSNVLYIPPKLTRYMEVVHDSGLPPEEIKEVVTNTCKPLKMDPPENQEALFRGLTSFEIQSNLIQTFKKTRGHADPKVLTECRFKQLRKTDLVRYVDTSEFTFEQIGGADRFKTWARQTTAAWTPEGREFGLEPPRGVLAVGVWGTGKSLSIKALGNTWGLPLIQFDLGALRQSGVGDSESNVYRALKVIEAAAPCVIWTDEAEKSFAGGHSSSFTDAGTTSRMIGIISTWLQETQAPVCLAMTANSLRTLPVEMTNRADERWFFDLPSPENRIDILKIHLKKRGQDPGDYNLAKLSEMARNMVGREIEQCIKASLVESFTQSKDKLDEEILLKALERKPRIVNTMVDEIKETLDWVGFDPDADDGVRARFAADPSGQDRKLSIA